MDARLRIGRALLDAAGLPERDSPFEIQWPDDRQRPDLTMVVGRIRIAAFGPGKFGDKPLAISRDLEKLQLDIGDIRRRIENIDGEVRGALNRAADPLWREYRTVGVDPDADADRIMALSTAIDAVPRDRWAVPAAVAALRALEKAIPEVIAKADKAAQDRPATGRKKNEAAHNIAVLVAAYVRDVTGELPEDRRKYSGSFFEDTLAEVFDALDLNADPQSPAKSALTTLRAKRSTNV